MKTKITLLPPRRDTKSSAPAKCRERHPVKLIRGLPTLLQEGKKRGLVSFR